MRYKTVIYIPVMLASFCLSVVAQSEKGISLNADDEVRFLVLSKIIQPWIPESAKAKTICVSVDNKNPNKQLLTKLKAISKKVKARSACYLDRNDGDLVRENISGKRSVMLEISGLKKLTENRVEVLAGSYVGNMGADGCKYVLTLEDGQWKIVSSDECYIS